jgi:hypothetical protein
MGGLRELLLTISRWASRFEAQSKVTVGNDVFRSERSSQKGADLNPGVYKLEITMPVSQVQPPKVRAVIGMAGWSYDWRQISVLSQRGVARIRRVVDSAEIFVHVVRTF